MTGFTGFELSPALMRSLENMNYVNPTQIQMEAIPLALQGRDILGSAQTGTGKTAAFAIPMVEGLMRQPHGSAVIMTPTRELARQVMEVVKQLLGFKSDINMAFLIGGEPMRPQLNQLARKPRIIIGTPGRINDHLERRSLKLDDAGFLVLDETDRMLDMGFGIQIDAIVKHMPSERQTLLFSATLPKEIIRLSNKYMTDPVRIAVGQTHAVAENIQQDVMRISEGEKYGELVHQLGVREGSVIIFMKTKFSTERMAKRLREDGHEADALHGDLKQSRRDRAVRMFREGKFRVLVATDVAARGLDIPHIEHVINYDLPQVAEDYIHRIGRTARAGAQGSALCFIAPADGRKWRAIEQLLNPGAKPSNDFGDDSGKDRGRGGKSRFGGNGGGNGGGRSRNDGPRDFGYKQRPPREFGHKDRFEKDGASQGQGRDFEARPPRERSNGGEGGYDRARPAADRSAGGGFRDRKPFGDSPKPWQNKQEGRSFGAKRDENGSSERRPWSKDGERGSSDRQGQDRFKPRFDQGDRPRGDRPLSDRPERSDRPFGGRPRDTGSREGGQFDRSAGGDRPRNHSGGGYRQDGDRPAYAKSQKPWENREGRFDNRGDRSDNRSSEGRSEYRGDRPDNRNGEGRSEYRGDNRSENRPYAPSGKKPFVKRDGQSDGYKGGGAGFKGKKTGAKDPSKSFSKNRRPDGAEGGWSGQDGRPVGKGFKTGAQNANTAPRQITEDKPAAPRRKLALKADEADRPRSAA